MWWVLELNVPRKGFSYESRGDLQRHNFQLDSDYRLEFTSRNG